MPINPLLKPEQVAYILRDCNVRKLVSSRQRIELLALVLRECGELRAIVATALAGTVATLPAATAVGSEQGLSGGGVKPFRVIDTDMAAILHTSDDTGKPKGVVLSRRSMLCRSEERDAVSARSR